MDQAEMAGMSPSLCLRRTAASIPQTLTGNAENCQSERDEASVANTGNGGHQQIFSAHEQYTGLMAEQNEESGVRLGPDQEPDGGSLEPLDDGKCLLKLRSGTQI